MTENPAEKEALDYLQAVRAAETESYILGTFDVGKAPRLAPAARAIVELLRKGPQSWAVTVVTGHQASDLALKSVDNWVRQACQVGILEKSGEYKSWYDRRLKRRRVQDTRQVSLGLKAGHVAW